MKTLIFILLLLPFYTQAQDSYGNNTELGIPKDADSTDDYIIVRSQYTVSYNQFKGVPNWVSSNLNKNWFGDVERYDGNFITDKSLPSGMYQVKHADYTNSGYDRGHLVRSEERTSTIEDNKATFLMTNIIPQTPDLNRKVWLNLEYDLEKLCKDGNKEIYVIAGGFSYTGKKLSSSDKVEVPDSCFKIAVILEYGEGLQDITEATKIIAVKMPNIEGISGDWLPYASTVDAIEASTGYDFLDLIPDEIENIIEAKKSYTSVEPTVKKNWLSVYPNPTNGCIHLDSIDKIQITNSLGLPVPFEQLSENEITIESLPVGLYYIKSNTDIVKIVKY